MMTTKQTKIVLFCGMLVLPLACVSADEGPDPESWAEQAWDDYQQCAEGGTGDCEAELEAALEASAAAQGEGSGAGFRASATAKCEGGKDVTCNDGDTCGSIDDWGCQCSREGVETQKTLCESKPSGPLPR